MNQRRAVFLLFLSIVFFFGVSTAAQQNAPPAPPTEVKAFDNPNDAGGTITITWKKSADDGAGENDVLGYEILRSMAQETGYGPIGTASLGATNYVDTSAVDRVTYYYRVAARDRESSTLSEETIPAVASPQWFNRRRTNMLISVVLFSFLILWFIERAKRGEKLFIRPLAGLEAIEEGIGRATEMGKPVLYIPGILDMDDIQTIASMAILSRVAKMVAQYDIPLLVPSKMPIAFTMAQEVVKQAYIEAGRPDAYNSDNIPFITMAQFGYAAAVNGIMLRQRPGTILYLGAFYAESLILAETGSSIGAIQIAGTAMPAQLPFFVVACDYTLIGEELFAASAYLSGEPRLLGSLKGQDWGKAVFMAFIALGAILETLGLHFLTGWLVTW
ncbi:MAG: fibronectin type III domain-containing protein [Candidatus Latescibacteria bacterium]|nr:fibronectin type III domain-containing protein [Candidatus Latescibacterota bacterium]